MCSRNSNGVGDGGGLADVDVRTNIFVYICSHRRLLLMMEESQHVVFFYEPSKSALLATGQ